MRIGVPKEIKNHEYRVGLTPGSVRELVAAGHEVFVQTNAGAGIGYGNAEYRAVGGHILSSAREVFDQANLIVKVKEPQLAECALLRPGQALFAYLHLAADPAQANGLLSSGATAIAYETVTDDDDGLPLLRPMSEIAGRMSIQVGAHCLEKAQGGGGILLGGVPGVPPGKVTILGGGVAGTNAAKMAVGLAAHVTILDRSTKRLQQLDDLFQGRIRTVYSTSETIEQFVTEADLVIGAVLIPGAAAPKLVSRDLIHGMKAGSVMVDIAIDQGGCFETSRPTTHEEPTYIIDNIVHYCVTNMPSAVARTSTQALTNVTLPFVLELANKGIFPALADNTHLANGLNVHAGSITHRQVAKALNKPFCPGNVTKAA